MTRDLDPDRMAADDGARGRDEAGKRMPATPPRTVKPKGSSLGRRSPVQDAHDRHANTDKDPHS